jgi:MraZ protein
MCCKVGWSGVPCRSSQWGQPGWQGSSHPATSALPGTPRHHARCTLAFRGTFDFTLDAKNRLTIPSKHRAAFADGVVLAAGLERCVGLWRPEDYDAWTASVLAGRNPLSPDYRQLQRHFTANSVHTELDGAGRVMLPGYLKDYAGVDREVALVGAGESLEVWEREKWNAYNGDVVANVAEIAAGLGE